MQELKRDYTIVIVTHNMQQAARVSDMTAFFRARGRADGADRHPGGVRPDRQDLHQPDGQAHRGLRHREIRMKESRSRKTRHFSQASAPGRGRARPPRAARRAQRARASDAELADEVIAFDDEVDRRYLEGRAGDRGPARPADAGRGRPAPRPRDAPHQPPPRAHGGLLRHDRQAHEAGGTASSRPADIQAFEEMGSRGRGDDQGRARRLRRPRRRRGFYSPGRAGRAHRPGEPALAVQVLELHRPGADRVGRTDARSSRAASRESGTMPSTSASRSPTS